MIYCTLKPTQINCLVLFWTINFNNLYSEQVISIICIIEKYRFQLCIKLETCASLWNYRYVLHIYAQNGKEKVSKQLLYRCQGANFLLNFGIFLFTFRWIVRSWTEEILIKFTWEKQLMYIFFCNLERNNIPLDYSKIQLSIFITKISPND